MPVDDGHFDDVPRLVEHEVVVPGVAVLQTPEAKKEDHSNILLRVLLILNVTRLNVVEDVPSCGERDDDLSSSKSEWGDDMWERKRLFVVGGERD